VASPSDFQPPDIPDQVASVLPTEVPGAGHMRQMIEAFDELRTEVRGARGDRHSDFVFMISVFAGGFLLLAAMLIFGYFKLEDRIEALSGRIGNLEVSAAKADTKLDDLIARIPPTPTAAPRK
jgi:hypothetical protein